MMNKSDLQMVDAYAAGRSLREISKINGCAIETVRKVLIKARVPRRDPYKHHGKRGKGPPRRDVKTQIDVLPCVGEWPSVLYAQGSCQNCGIAMFGKESKRRSLCGHCAPG